MGDKACRKCPANSVPEKDSYDYLREVWEQRTGSKQCGCNAGYTGMVNSRGSQCSACDEGKYKEDHSPSSKMECTQCTLFASSSVRGATSAASCSCNAGYMPDDLRDPCTFPCTLSSASNRLLYGVSCTACERGKYKDSRGNVPCTSCPNNTDQVSWNGNTDVSSCISVIKPKCEKNVYGNPVDCVPIPSSASQSQGVFETLIVAGLVVGMIFTS
jgi:hypothetical protein